MNFRASDLWAIGCIIYQLMTGLPPFQSQSEFLIFKKIEKLDYSFHEGFNEDAKHLVQQLLVIEPQNRFGSWLPPK
jgi:3-phosphoinositide dependent protein kinase-1